MAFCNNCGNEIPDGVKFCSNCGAPVGNVASANRTDQAPLNSTYGNTPNNMSGTRADLNPYVDPTRLYAIPPQPAPEPTGIDKFGRFFWIPLLVLTIVDIMSDPPILTLILAIMVIGEAIFGLSRKYKMKGFIIISLILAVICLLTSVGQAKKYGLFRVPAKDEYTSSSDKDEDADTSASDKGSSNTTTSDAPKSQSPAEVASTGGVDPELKAFLDSYEEFVDEYVEFMKNYMANPLDVGSMLGDYTEMMNKLADFETKLNKYDTDKMSTEDAAYYLEVTTRCSQKMMGIL